MASGFDRLCHAYFTVLDPILAVGGTYVCIFAPLHFVQSTLDPAYKTLSRVERATIAQLGAEYLVFAVCGGLVLRSTRDRRVWRGIFAACAFSDIVHLYGVAVVGGMEKVTAFWLWSWEDWIAIGILWFGLILRLAWLLVK